MPLKTLSGQHADPRKGRGAGINPEGRFENVEREAYDDGWDTPDEEERALKTQVTDERVKSVISRNDSPDIPFTQSINPYAGCEHGCVYCLSGDTPILMGDGRAKPLADVRVGDEIYGTVREGWYRRYRRTRVLAHWSVVKPAYRITLEDGTTLTAGPDHRFLTERGWRFVSDGPRGAQRPHLTTGNKLMGVGGFAAAANKDADYERGYLCGMIRGDGLLASYSYARVGRRNGDQHQFRFALCDGEALERTRLYLQQLSIETYDFEFQRAIGGRQAMRAIRTYARNHVERIRAIIAWPADASRSWMAGFLAGIFDAEGSYSGGIVRISNTDSTIVDWIARACTALALPFAIEHVGHVDRKAMHIVRLTGGLAQHLRFFHIAGPAIMRKLDIQGQAVKSTANLQIASIEPVGRAMRLYDITTGTEDFIANGVVSHNCYARPSHAYRNLSPGIDFETRIFARVNAAERLREELSKPAYVCESITLGANTDPYQPVERSRGITRAVLEVCAEFNQPVTIVTKNALVERDIDILAPMAHEGLAQVFVSCNNLEHELARRLEPRCSAPKRRLEAMRALSDAGIPVGVLVAPVSPFLTDHEIEPVLEAAWSHGARSAGYVLLRLPWEVKALFEDWLARHYPLKAKHVMSRVHDMRGGRDNDPRFRSRMIGEGTLAKLLSQRFAAACRKLGFNERRTEPTLDTTKFRRPDDGAQLTLF
jgi:DNA repair photolyase